MNSIWLCCDPAPAKPLDLKAAKIGRSYSAPQAHFGIFNDSPATIGSRLPRPGTPFAEPAEPEMPVKQIEILSHRLGPICESPPSTMSFDFDRKGFSALTCAIAIF